MGPAGGGGGGLEFRGDVSSGPDERTSISSLEHEFFGAKPACNKDFERLKQPEVKFRV